MLAGLIMNGVEPLREDIYYVSPLLVALRS
jgi:hypothetical protein